MSQLLDELSDIYGLGPPIRPFRISRRKKSDSGYGSISRYEIAPENAFAIWDQWFLMLPCPGGLRNNEFAKKYILRLSGFCKDRRRFFFGDSVIRGTFKQIAFQGPAIEDRVALLEQFLVRAFGYDGLLREIKYYRQADPEIVLAETGLGSLSDIIREYQ